ncbi:WD domain G-beta repeat [Carpediemonas membranifera]|uniref:Elongator complex protein 2 n=1 Tax=Carpediemonas membranifera TaxID=201153 RepID=A0A8J6AXS3_9EUKA|nr:WD domain G-beta repeat [Carpediemonas membranifera]|eukprot:KAG9389854.1 WD domain G-beta repeat [Carpediemonas membranifera]
MSASHVIGATAGPTRYQCCIKWGICNYVIYGTTAAVAVWNTQANSIILANHHRAPVRQVAWMHDEAQHPISEFVSGDIDGNIVYWALNEGKPSVMAEIKLATSSPPAQMVAGTHSGHRFIAIVQVSGDLTLLVQPQPGLGFESHAVTPPSTARAMCLASLSGRLLVGDMAGRVSVISLDTLTVELTFGSVSAWVADLDATTILYSADGISVVAAAVGNTVQLWQLTRTTATILRTCQDAGDIITSVAFSKSADHQSDTLLAAGCGDRSIFMYTMAPDLTATLDSRLGAFGASTFIGVTGVCCDANACAGQTMDGALLFYTRGKAAESIEEEGENWVVAAAPSGPAGKVSAICPVSQDAVLVASHDRTVRIFHRGAVVSEIARPLVHGYPVAGATYISGLLLVWAGETSVRILRPTESFKRTANLFNIDSISAGYGIGAVQPPMRLLNKPMFVGATPSLFERALLDDHQVTEVSEFRPGLIAQIAVDSDPILGIPADVSHDEALRRTLWGQHGEVPTHGPVTVAAACVGDDGEVMLAMAPEASRPSDCAVEVVRLACHGDYIRHAPLATMAVGEVVSSLAMEGGTIAVGTGTRLLIFRNGAEQVLAVDSPVSAVALESGAVYAVSGPTLVTVSSADAEPVTHSLGSKGVSLSVSGRTIAVGRVNGTVAVARDGKQTDLVVGAGCVDRVALCGGLLVCGVGSAVVWVELG